MYAIICLATSNFIKRIIRPVSAKADSFSLGV